MARPKRGRLLTREDHRRSGASRCHQTQLGELRVNTHVIIGSSRLRCEAETCRSAARAQINSLWHRLRRRRRGESFRPVPRGSPWGEAEEFDEA